MKAAARRVLADAASGSSSGLERSTRKIDAHTTEERVQVRSAAANPDAFKQMVLGLGKR